MSYLDAPFDHDLFVSYAHADPQGKGSTDLKHWSQRLVEKLLDNIQAVEVVFDGLDVFIDKDLDPTAKLTPTLKKKVEGSGLLLLIMSPHYLKSAWCGDELGWFERAMQDRAQSQGCVLVVRAVRTKEDAWPGCLKDEQKHSVLGFWFHPRSEGDGPFPFGWPDPQPQDRQFYMELGKLATIVIRRLRELKEYEILRREAAAPAVRIEIAGSPCIYLQGGHVDEPAWRTVKASLEEAGCEVRPDHPARVEGDFAARREARQERIADLKEAHALLILRSSDGDWIEGEIEAAATDRADLDAFSGRDIPCAVLDQVGGDLPLAQDLGIERIDARDGHWLLRVQAWLAGALAAPVVGAGP